MCVSLNQQDVILAAELIASKMKVLGSNGFWHLKGDFEGRRSQPLDPVWV